MQIKAFVLIGLFLLMSVGAAEATLLFHTTLDNSAAVTTPAIGTGTGSSVVSTPNNDFTTGKFNNGIRLDSIGEYVRFSQINGNTKNVELDQGTIDLWFQPLYNHNNGVKYRIFSNGLWGTPGSFGVGKHNNANFNSFYLHKFGSNGALDAINTIPVDKYGWNANEWVNLRVTWNWKAPAGVQNIHVYFNGVEAQLEGDNGKPVTTGTWATAAESSTNHIYIGAVGPGNDSNIRNDAVFDEVKIWDEVIPPNTCIDNTWSPTNTGKCGTITQTSNCGNTRTVQGTVTCSTGQTCTNNICVTQTTTPQPTTTKGDLNQDGKVDITDLNALISKLGTVPHGTPEDLNSDGKVNILDIAILTRNWGTTSSTPPPSDTTPPTATINTPTNNQQFQTGTSQTTLSVTTNEPSTCRWSTSNQAYTSMPTANTLTGSTIHTATLTGLINGQSYTRYVRCIDAAGNAMQSSTTVTFSVANTQTTPTPPSGSLVQFNDPNVEKIIGPLTPSGTSPWTFFDTNQITKGLEHGSNFPASPSLEPIDDNTYQNRNYYDLGLTLYSAYYRTGDPQFLTLARKVTDSWWQHNAIANGTRAPEDSMAPRSIALGGLMMRALDGRPEMWPWITTYTRHHHWSWLERHTTRQTLWYGVRDGGYMLHYASLLSQVHPDPAVRAEFANKSAVTSKDYFARLQYPDGGWYWLMDVDWDSATPDVDASQPFQVGLLLEGMISKHQATQDPALEQAILKAAEWLYVNSYETQATTNLPNVRWRAMRYFTIASDYTSNNRQSAFLYGKTDGAIRDARELNPTTVHTFGYAYYISGDIKYRNYGDEVFAATFGKGQGPLADAYYSLADYRGKEYNQNYRSAGKYLGWREMGDQRWGN